MSEKITAEQVSLAVKDFWSTFTGSSPEKLVELYAPDATIFGVEGSRPEPARLALARRAREYFDRKAKIVVRTDPAEVRLVGETLAIASYCFHFSASNVGAAPGKTVQRTIAHGRATQVFQAGGDGRLLIVHEHLSSADIRKE